MFKIHHIAISSKFSALVYHDKPLFSIIQLKFTASSTPSHERMRFPCLANLFDALHTSAISRDNRELSLTTIASASPVIHLSMALSSYDAVFKAIKDMIRTFSGMRDDDVKEGYVRKVELDELAKLLIRGGWPENIDMDDEDIGVIPESYIEAIVTKDMHERQPKKRSPQKMRMLLRALARHEASLAGDQTLVKDIEEYETSDELIESRATIADYTSVLDSLYLISNQEAYSVHYRSSTRIGKTAKRHLVDPSLSCACLQLTTEKLMNDHATFGLMFEAMVERDLRIYADYLEGHLYHFRDNISGDEVDAIVEFKDGEYAAFEIKLSDGSIQDGIKSLSRFYENVEKKPSYMCVIIGHLESVMRDPETGIYIVPFTSLKP